MASSSFTKSSTHENIQKIRGLVDKRGIKLREIRANTRILRPVSIYQRNLIAMQRREMYIIYKKSQMLEALCTRRRTVNAVYLCELLERLKAANATVLLLHYRVRPHGCRNATALDGRILPPPSS